MSTGRVLSATALAVLPIATACATQVDPDLAYFAIGLDDGGFDAFGSVPVEATGGAGSFIPDTSSGGDPFPAPPPEGVAGTAPDDPGNGGECGAGYKRCGGLCVSPTPAIGCDPVTCNPCPPAPEHSQAFCADGQCSWECSENYVASSGSCTLETAPTTGTGGTFSVPSNTGGTTSTPTTPSTGSCNALNCTGCSVVGPFGCCRPNGTCGCTWAPGAYCL